MTEQRLFVLSLAAEMSLAALAALFPSAGALWSLVLLGAVFLLVWVAVPVSHLRRVRGPKMIQIVGMGLSLFAFVGFAAWFLLTPSFPIAWSFENFLGASARVDTGVYVGQIQIEGVVIGSKQVTLQDAYIRSGITGRRLPALISAESGYVPAPALNPLQPGARFWARALFFEPGSNVPAGRLEGLSEQEFLAEWSRFKFVAEIDDREFDHVFGEEEIRARIDALRPKTTTAPHPTVK